MKNNIKKIKLSRYNNIIMRKSSKFKSIGISIVYKLKYDYKNITAFNILAKYLGNCNQDYPSIELFNKHIESLYGCNVGIKTSYLSSLFACNFFVNFINPKYVNDDSLIENAIKLLHDLIYKPLLVEDKLQKDIFDICKQNCMIDIASLKEYNLNYVLRKLKQTLSKDENSAMCSSYLGNEKVIMSLNEKNILKYYNRLLHAPFDIYITGDYNENEVIDLLKKYFKKTGIKNTSFNVFDMIETKTYEPLIIKKNVSQAKVAIAYKIPILFDDPRHYAFRIARLILSGTLSSKFGKVIREEMGLCYSISSTYSSYYGTFIVTTGVASENINKVVNEVDNQIKLLKNGNVTDEEFLQAKEAILSDLTIIDDSLFGTLNMVKTYHAFNEEFILEDEIKKYENVSKNDVIEAAKLLTYSTYVALDKE